MRLFKRSKPHDEPSICPRCSHLADGSDAITCPMCGWDLRDAYQGPKSAPHERTPATTAASDGADGS